MPDELSLHDDLAARAGDLLRAVPDLATATGLTLTAGTYVANDGTTFTEHGVARTPRFVLRVATGDAEVTGTDVSFDEATLDTGVAVPLFVLEERADAVLDDEDTIAGILSPYGTIGAQWAAAIASAPDRLSLLGQSLQSAQPPPGAPSDDPAVLGAWLERHFTYTTDGGAYYAKWVAADPANAHPDDTTDAYREAATVEHVLDRDRFHALIVQTADEPGSAGHAATETLVRIEEDPEGSATITVLYEAARIEPTVVNDVCVFHAAQGRGLAVPPSARGTLRPDLARLGHEQAVPGQTPRLDNVVQVGANDRSIKVSAVVRPGSFVGDDLPPLPEGVTYLGGPLEDEVVETAPDDTGDPIGDSQQEHVRYFAAPIEQLVALAAIDDVLTLSAVRVSRPSVDQARTTIDHAGYLANLGVNAGGGGDGVVVGIVDSGIDGTHPAFAGRIEAVWDQHAPDDPAHPPPPGRGNDFGQVWDTVADIEANSTDPLGHGTHVAGIAAGAPGGTHTTTGVAPEATLVIGRVFDADGNGGDDDNIRRAVQWCFRQAGTRPCVVNLSLGGYGHGHDGVDDFSLSIRRTYRRPNAARDGFDWVRGRVVTAAAGNAGQSAGHSHLASLAPAATSPLPVTITTQTDPSTGVTSAPPDALVNLFGRPLPSAARGCRFDVRVRLASGAAQTPWFGFNAAGNLQSSTLGTVTVDVYNGPAPTGLGLGLQFTQHRFVQVNLEQVGGLPTTQYVIDVRNASTDDIEVHGYLPQAQGVDALAPAFFANATLPSTVGSPATAFGTVSVGATINRASWRPQGAPSDGSGDVTNREVTLDATTNLPASFAPATVGAVALMTDPGPVRGTSRTLTAMLPGDGVLSAMTSLALATPNDTLFDPSDIVDATTGQMTGTSMATPVATGLIACLLANKPRLTAGQVGGRLRDAAGVAPSGWDADLYGDGPTDASLIDVG